MRSEQIEAFILWEMPVTSHCLRQQDVLRILSDGCPSSFTQGLPFQMSCIAALFPETISTQSIQHQNPLTYSLRSHVSRIHILATAADESKASHEGLPSTGPQQQAPAADTTSIHRRGTDGIRNTPTMIPGRQQNLCVLRDRTALLRQDPASVQTWQLALLVPMWALRNWSHYSVCYNSRAAAAQHAYPAQQGFVLLLFQRHDCQQMATTDVGARPSMHA